MSERLGIANLRFVDSLYDKKEKKTIEMISRSYREILRIRYIGDCYWLTTMTFQPSILSSVAIGRSAVESRVLSRAAIGGSTVGFRFLNISPRVVVALGIRSHFEENLFSL